MLIFKYYY